MNNIIKLFFLILCVFFLSLYFGRYTTDYYENKKVLTDEAIIQFEKDLKEGKEIVPSHYMTPEKNYQNKVSSFTLKTSHFIESVFRKGLKTLVRYLDNS